MIRKYFIQTIKVGEGDMKVTLRSAKIIERMINQNTFDEINQGILKESHSKKSNKIYLFSRF